MEEVLLPCHDSTFSFIFGSCIVCSVFDLLCMIIAMIVVCSISNSMYSVRV